MTLLKNGKFLVAGGRGLIDAYPGCESDLKTAELFDPETGNWEMTGSMQTARSGHSGILLADGRAIVVGTGAELYDPNTGTWSPASSFPSNLNSCSATLLKDGSILATGGKIGANANKDSYLYNPATNLWTQPAHSR